MARSESDNFLGRAARVAKVGAGLSSAATQFGFNTLFGGEDGDAKSAKALREALGGIKGPLMKVAQILSTIPDAVPPEFAEELAQLQAHAPAMGWNFVRRRMKAELGPDWQGKFTQFEQQAAHAASLGQVHRAVLPDGRAVACKLQYPDMQSAVEADLAQMRMAMGVIKRVERSIDASEAGEEIAARLREELDYGRERKAMALYQHMLSDVDSVRVPEPVDSHSTDRLLTMSWVSGRPILDFKSADQDIRNALATALFKAWWVPMVRYGVIHGDPHLGNYTVADQVELASSVPALSPFHESKGPNHTQNASPGPDAAETNQNQSCLSSAPAINLLDFGCIRIFPPGFVAGVVQLYRALLANDVAAERAAYETWGFEGLTDGQQEALTLWARFIFRPLLDDRVRTVADGVAPSEYGRKEFFEVRRLLKERGPVKIPREFVFMDRAAIGLGAVFLHLDATLNFYQLFQDSIAGFDQEALAQRQGDVLTKVGLGASA